MSAQLKEKHPMKSALTLCPYLIAGLLVVSACRVATTPPAVGAASVGIIPKPQQLDLRPGVFKLTAQTGIFCEPADEKAQGVARYLAEKLRAATGGAPAVSQDSAAAGAAAIVLKKSSGAALGEEGYLLRVRPDGIAIEAASPAGLFYGVQTILQLLPADAYAGRGRRAAISLPCLDIQDSPRLKWRGMMLDCSRHFFPKEFVLKYIDLLAAQKMNTFHWHFTDDQGWRVEIMRYPRLTEIGAWRVDREDKPWNERPPQKEDEKATYGGFYTQDDIREVVAYAASRFITVVPEIEMPGHCLAALASYPQYSCKGGPFTVPPGGVWPILDVYCPGNEETFEFIENILSEVCDLFPSEYIHIGGDEVDKATWKACPKCQARIASEGLKDEEELQSYFVKRIEKFLNSKGKKLIGWDEILQGGLAPNAAVMSWRGTEGGITAARAGHDVVMSPTSHCYFDYYQGDPANEPLAIGGYIPLRKVYSFDPVPSELTAAEAEHIIGVQANLWTEYVAAPEHAEYMTFPRAAAVAEIGWTAKEKQDWTDFTRRLDRQFARYEAMGINFARSAYAVQFAPAVDPVKKRFGIRLETDTYKPEIRYTLDGTPPVAASPAYQQPLLPKKSCVIRAAAFLAGRPVGKPAEVRLTVHKALGIPASLDFPPQEPNAGAGPLALTDGLRGTPAPGDPRWQGFQGDDLVATIKLKKMQKIGWVSAGFLQRSDSWIFLPRSLEIAVSTDGKNFETVETLTHEVPPLSPGTMVKEFSAPLSGRKARFVRVRAQNIGVCPEGHRAAGQKAWLFADEIVVE
jgi:hexosaminidase